MSVPFITTRSSNNNHLIWHLSPNENQYFVCAKIPFLNQDLGCLNWEQGSLDNLPRLTSLDDHYNISSYADYNPEVVTYLHSKGVALSGSVPDPYTKPYAYYSQGSSIGYFDGAITEEYGYRGEFAQSVDRSSVTLMHTFGSDGYAFKYSCTETVSGWSMKITWDSYQFFVGDQNSLFKETWNYCDIRLGGVTTSPTVTSTWGTLDGPSNIGVPDASSQGGSFKPSWSRDGTRSVTIDIPIGSGNFEIRLRDNYGQIAPYQAVHFLPKLAFTDSVDEFKVKVDASASRAFCASSTKYIFKYYSPKKSIYVTKEFSNSVFEVDVEDDFADSSSSLNYTLSVVTDHNCQSSASKTYEIEASKETLGCVETPEGAYITARVEGTPKSVVIRRMEAEQTQGTALATLNGMSRPRLAFHADGRLVLLVRDDASKTFARRVSLDGGKSWPQ